MKDNEISFVLPTPKSYHENYPLTEKVRKLADDFLMAYGVSKSATITTHDLAHLLGRIFRHVEYFEKSGKVIG